MAFRSFGITAATGLLLVFAAAFGPGLAHAESGLDLCNDVLRQDLFNRTAGSSQASESERTEALRTFLTMKEDDAFDQYKKAYTEDQNKKMTGHAEGQYGLIRGELDLSYEHGQAMSREDFHKAFTHSQDLHKELTSSSSSKDSSAISRYTTAVRDPATIEAWRACMRDKTADSSMFAYGYRDANGNPYLTVMWVPGHAVTSILVPRVRVHFIVPEPGVEVDAGDQPVEVAGGSGTAFALRYKETATSRAKFGSFVVIVDGAAYDGDRKLADFHEEATIPQAVGAIPCEIIFKSGGSYPIALYPSMLENKLNAAMWSLAHLTLERTDPAAPAGTIAYQGQLVLTPPGKPPSVAPFRLSLRGENIELTDVKSGQTGTGECALGMARGSIAPSRPNLPPIRFAIRGSQ